jgi:hypothetical protein
MGTGLRNVLHQLVPIMFIQLGVEEKGSNFIKKLKRYSSLDSLGRLEVLMANGVMKTRPDKRLCSMGETVSIP